MLPLAKYQDVIDLSTHGPLTRKLRPFKAAVLIHRLLATATICPEKSFDQPVSRSLSATSPFANLNADINMQVIVESGTIIKNEYAWRPTIVPDWPEERKAGA